jgi:hypothetical protein
VALPLASGKQSLRCHIPGKAWERELSVNQLSNHTDRPYFCKFLTKTPINSPLKSNVAALNGNVPVLNGNDRVLKHKIEPQYENVQAQKGKGEG